MGRRRKHSVDCPYSEEIPPQRNAANERERDRMRVVSKAFGRLKRTLPWVPPDTKLSKLDTLRLATCYIAHLKQVLDDDEEVDLRGKDRSECHQLDDDEEVDLGGKHRSECHQLVAPFECSNNGTVYNLNNNSTSITFSGKTGPTAVNPLNLTWPYSLSGKVTSLTELLPCVSTANNETINNQSSQSLNNMCQ